jgi:hypothetical protein
VLPQLQGFTELVQSFETKQPGLILHILLCLVILCGHAVGRLLLVNLIRVTLVHN